MNTLPNANKMKHYRYHRNFGHTTEDYWVLKDKIEELVQADHLCRFVQRSQEDQKHRIDEGRTLDRWEERAKEMVGIKGKGVIVDMLESYVA